MDQRTNATFAVIDAIQTDAMSLDNYSLGSQDSGFAIVFCLRVEGWLRMKHFCLLSCLVVAEFPTSLRKISAESWFDNQ